MSRSEKALWMVYNKLSQIKINKSHKIQHLLNYVTIIKCFHLFILKNIHIFVTELLKLAEHLYSHNQPSSAQKSSLF